jgi:hypothetical protein
MPPGKGRIDNRQRVHGCNPDGIRPAPRYCTGRVLWSRICIQSKPCSAGIVFVRVMPCSITLANTVLNPMKLLFIHALNHAMPISGTNRMQVFGKLFRVDIIVAPDVLNYFKESTGNGVFDVIRTVDVQIFYGIRHG